MLRAERNGDHFAPRDGRWLSGLVGLHLL